MDKADLSTSWRNTDKVDMKYEEDSLIAISSREKTISIWSTKTGRQLVALRLPGTGGGRNKGPSDKMTFTTCYWRKRNLLLSSGAHGELFEWNLDRLIKRTADGILRSEGNGPEVNVIHREHAKTLYSISSTGSSIQTSGQDRSVVSFSRDMQTLDFNLPTFAAWVYALAPNNVDPTIIAMGAGDGQIRIWKTASAKAKFEVNIIWQKLNSAKVTSLAWHPDKDNIIAFGTDEGRVGTVDAFSSRSIPAFCDFKHRSTVYNLCWGPPVFEKKEKACKGSIMQLFADTKCLYSCGDGQVMMHSARQEDKTINVDTIISSTNNFSRKDPSRSDVLFQPNLFEYLVLGSDDGSIEIFKTPNLQILCVLKSFNKLIQSLAWHPLHIGVSSIASSYHLWLATASNEHDIHVWNLSESLSTLVDDQKETSDEKCREKTVIEEGESVDQAKPDIPVFSTPTVILSGHHQRVIYLSWSPHEDARLLSVSYDCTAQVWDVSKKEPICNFSGHKGRLFCGLWSPLDSNVVYTGGEDSTVYGWNIQLQNNKLPIKKAAKKIAVRKGRDIKEQSVLSDDVQIILDTKRKEIIMSDDQIKMNEAYEVGVNERDNRDRSTNVRRRHKKKSYFPLSFQHENMSKSNAFNDCQMLSKFLSGDDKESISEDTNDLMRQPHLSFFADKSRIDDLLAIEEDTIKEQGDHDIAAHLSLWSGNLIETIRTASNTGKLTDWLVSAAAGISYSLWKEMCVSYAAQLIKEDEIVKGASYYLMIHQVLEAIEILKKSHFYRPAISIAKSRLPDDAPLLQEIYKSWALQATNDGSYELAAKCWIAAGDYLQASILLAKRTDTSSLRVASFLAAKSGEQEKSRILATQCAAQCVKSKDWICLERLVQEANHPAIDQMWEDTKPSRNESIVKNSNVATSDAKEANSVRE